MRTEKHATGRIALSLLLALALLDARAQAQALDPADPLRGVVLAGRAHAAETGPPATEPAPAALPALPDQASAGAPAPAAPEPPRPPTAAPTEAADGAGFNVVRVTGLRAAPWKSYRALQAALAAFQAYRGLAPDAVFSFALMAPAGATLPPNFSLRVRTRDGREIPIALEHGELFQLPALPEADTDADLVSNLRGGRLRIGLLVHTRGVPPASERLGDARLRERIRMAIDAVDRYGADPAALRRALQRSNCKPFKATVWFLPAAPTRSAWLAHDGQREPVPAIDVRGRRAYRMPVCDTYLGDDTLIEFDYLAPPRLTLAETAIYDPK